MAKKRPADLHYPKHWFTPEDLLTFVELPPFTRRWGKLKLTDRDLEALQVMIMTQPTCGDVIEDTGGLRKLRFAPAASKQGKSGGYRVCYIYFQEVSTIVLAIVYAKNEKDDLTQDEKKTISGVLQRIEKALLARPYRRNPRSESL